LVKRYIILSFKNQIEFKFDFYMSILAIFMEAMYVFVFWISIVNVGIAFDNWTTEHIFLLASFNILSAGISKMFFGFRDFEFKVARGEFDIHMIRPINPVAIALLEKLNITNIIGKVLIGSSMLITSSIMFNLEIGTVLMAVLILINATIVIELLYGVVTHACFFIGKIYYFRELLFSIRTATNYPLDIYPKGLFKFFTSVIPLAMISTIPTKISTGLFSGGKYFLISLLLVVIVFLFYKIVSKIAINSYKSSGS